jgi:hypothetical protein
MIDPSHQPSQLATTLRREADETEHGRMHQDLILHPARD